MQRAGRRPTLLFLWMVQKGCGILTDQYFVLSSRRLHASCALAHAIAARCLQPRAGLRIDSTWRTYGRSLQSCTYVAQTCMSGSHGNARQASAAMAVQ